MRVTVAVCTWNRGQLLQRTLDRMCDLRVPAGIDWELILVNNNSTDTTEQVARSFERRLPLRYVVEPKQGLSHARNCALELAGGDLICWTDDDVLLDPEWIASYVNAASRWPDAGFFGGHISPWFEHDPPPWLVRNEKLLSGLLVTRDLGPVEQPFPGNEFPYGANMGFRRSAVRGRRFDPKFGLVADNGVRHEETEFCRELQTAGISGVWVPSASAQHWVGANRMTLAYLWKFFEGSGRGKARFADSSDDRLLFGAPLWAYRAYVGAITRYAWHRLRRDDDAWFNSFTAAAEAWGVIVERRTQRRASVSVA